MKEQILKIAEHLKNGTIDEKQAKGHLLGLFGIYGSGIPFTVHRVNELLENISKETWKAAKGDLTGWKEWSDKRNKQNLNS